MTTYYREADGTTYYYKNGILYGTPTNIDNSFDTEAETAVEDYVEPLRTGEIEEITKALREAKTKWLKRMK